MLKKQGCPFGGPVFAHPEKRRIRLAARTHIAIAVVENGNDEFLVGLRSEGSVLAGYSEFPGGKVESGESPREAAVRECREETGLKVQAISELRKVQHAYDHGFLQLHFFYCRPLGDGKLVGGFRWVHRDALGGLQFPKANRGVIEQLVGRS